MKNKFVPAFVCSGLLPGLTGTALASIQGSNPVLAISRPAELGIRIDCSGAPVRPFILQTATRIQSPTWSNLTVAVPDARGSFAWLDATPKNEPCRFFRLAQVPGGLIAKGRIVFNGRACLDSYDSSDPTLSTDGLYDPAKRRDHALAQSALQAAGAISIGTGTLFGYASTGPGGTVTCAPNGVLGDFSWAATQKGIQPGHVSDTTTLLVQDISVPFTAGLPLLAGSYPYNGTNYSYLLHSGEYQAPGDLSLSGQQSMVVTGDAVLYVTGKFSLSGQAFIYIAPGATLRIFVAENVSVSGRGILNGTQRAANCSLFGLPGCRTITYSGNASFFGLVDAPEADVTLSGSAGACGGIIANSITLSGGAALHYDESLGL